MPNLSGDRLEWEGGRLQGGVEPGWEGRVRSWNSSGTPARGGWGTAPARPAWTDNKEVDQADDEEELTTDDEKDKVEGSFFYFGVKIGPGALDFDSKTDPPPHVQKSYFPPSQDAKRQ